MDDIEKKGSWWLGACSLDCNRCPIHLRTEEELDYWRKQNADMDKIRCDGCRSDRSGCHWSADCKVLQCCVYERGLRFCSECPDLPCGILEEWAKDLEHHAKAVKNLIRIREMGTDKYLAGLERSDKCERT